MTRRITQRMLAKRIDTRIARLSRWAIHWLVLLVVPLSPTVATGLGQSVATEAKAPFEQQERSEEQGTEEASLAYRGEKLRRRDPRQGRLLTPVMVIQLALQSVAPILPGHRLPNNLLAPLRC